MYNNNNLIEFNDNVNDITKEIYNAFLMKQKDIVTESLCVFISNHNSIKTIRNDDTEEIWIYKDGIYIPNGITYISEICRLYLGEMYTTQLKNIILNKIEADTYIEADDFFNAPNNEINLIPVLNGLLDLETHELLPFSPEKIFFNKLNVKYEPDKKCPAIKKFISQIVETKDDVNTIQELFGFAMMKEYRFEKAFMFLGNGRNGKGKLLNLLKRFIGLDSCANVSLQEIENDGFSLCELHNKLVNISGDISKNALNNTGYFKSLTGRDLIHAARKYKTRVKFENYAKMIFAANELPKTNDLTEAFFQRWEIINFPYTFYNEIDYKIHKDDKYTRLRNADILQQIITSEEMSGLLNWSLEGLERLIKNKVFSSTKNSESVRDTWIRRSDSSTTFIKELFVEDYDGFLAWSDIKQSYRTFCRTNGLKTSSDKDLRSSIINNTSGFAEKKYLSELDKQVRGYSGIKFKTRLFSHTPDKILNYLKNVESASYKSLKQIIDDDVILLSSLNSLVSEGKVSELPKGCWRMV